MTNSVNTNQSALIALQNLNSTNRKLSDAQIRISTGLKVGGAKDNAATWAIAQNQRADSGALESVKSSLDRATSIADVAMAAGEQISELLIELRQKAVSAADPSATPETRRAYNDDFQSLLRSIASFADNAQFDGVNILDGSDPDNLVFLASADAQDTIIMSRQDLSLDTLGLSSLDLLTPANSNSVLTAVEEALVTTTAALAALGAESKQITNHNIFVGKLMDSLETGVGNLVDADLAKESARLQALQIQQQLGTQALSIANQTPQSILSLFNS